MNTLCNQLDVGTEQCQFLDAATVLSFSTVLKLCPLQEDFFSSSVVVGLLGVFFSIFYMFSMNVVCLCCCEDGVGGAYGCTSPHSAADFLLLCLCMTSLTVNLRVC